MEESFRFDEEIYENAITIDLSNVANKASALYSISKRTMDIAVSYTHLDVYKRQGYTPYRKYRLYIYSIHGSKKYT